MVLSRRGALGDDERVLPLPQARLRALGRAYKISSLEAMAELYILHSRG